MATDTNLSTVAAALEATGRYRVLKRLELADRAVAVVDAPTSVGVVVDTETSALDPATCKIIELAARRFRFDGQGVITTLGRRYAWCEDPGAPLDPAITRLTGLTDADLAGQKIDTTIATELLRSAKVIVAHNARYDRPLVERRLPGASGLAWACTCSDIDWPANGFEGRSLGWLLAQCGWFFDGHRASADVDAVIALLKHVMPSGRTGLKELLEHASQPGWLIRAVGADFGAKEILRTRGYRWDSGAKTWWREVADGERETEKVWLAENVYAPNHRPKALGPTVTAVTWNERYTK
ncbi:MAG: 3'-5' exonuclease [Roseiarcus sp.]